MARRKTTSAVRRSHNDRRICSRTEQMRAVNKVTFYVLVLVGCGAVFATAVPQWKKLKEMETELAEVETVEARDLERKDHVMRVDRAIIEDPDYLEIQGRDSLNLSKPGEKIFRFERGE